MSEIDVELRAPDEIKYIMLILSRISTTFDDRKDLDTYLCPYGHKDVP